MKTEKHVTCDANYVLLLVTNLQEDFNNEKELLNYKYPSS